MKLYDGNKMVEIKMVTYDNTTQNMSPCFAEDFFSAGNLTMREDGAYIVDDVDYCVEQANDWKNCDGDFYGNEHDIEHAEPLVFVTEVE